MDNDERDWLIALSIVIGSSYIFVLALFLRSVYQNPIRKAKRDEISKKKKAHHDIQKVNRVNLDGRSVVYLMLNHWKLRKSDLLFDEYRAIIKRQCYKELYIPTYEENKRNISQSCVPYTHNRVILDQKLGQGWLTPLEVVDTHNAKKNKPGRYMNASWIKSSKTSMVYIASQIPLVSTVHEFWEMVWCTDCRVIVTIGNEWDHFKIIDYLGKDIRSTKVDYYEVAILEIKEYSGFVYKVIKLTNKAKKNSPKIRHIVHIHLPDWTLSSMPSSQTIIEARNCMMQSWSLYNDPSPIIVHCITGCSRTGTFIAICNLLDTIDECKRRKEDQQISWGHAVIEIREQRVNSINSVIQYISIFDTLCHYILSGWCHFNSHEFPEYMQYHSVEMETGKTRFEKQFENVNKTMSPILLPDCAAAIRPENLSKNRNMDILPRDINRPYLERTGSGKGADYINAVYVDGFKYKHEFIVTEWPTKTTTSDFWRMNFEKNVKCIVIMNNNENNENYPRFWSNLLKQRVGFGKISVQLTSDEYLNDSVRLQIFNIHKINNKLSDAHKRILEARSLKIICPLPKEEEKIVMMTHLLNWRDSQTVPNSIAELKEMIWDTKIKNNKVDANQSSMTQNPIVVVSNDGIHRAGVFCAGMQCFERINSTNQVDVFNAVAKVKKNRPKLIPTFHEFMLVYELCQEFITADNDEGYQDVPLND